MLLVMAGNLFLVNAISIELFFDKNTPNKSLLSESLAALALRKARRSRFVLN